MNHEFADLRNGDVVEVRFPDGREEIEEVQSGAWQTWLGEWLITFVNAKGVYPLDCVVKLVEKSRSVPTFEDEGD